MTERLADLTDPTIGEGIDNGFVNRDSTIKADGIRFE